MVLGRKQILDFYYLTASPSQCYALAYRPVYAARKLASRGMDIVHVQLPSETTFDNNGNAILPVRSVNSAPHLAALAAASQRRASTTINRRETGDDPRFGLSRWPTQPTSAHSEELARQSPSLSSPLSAGTTPEPLLRAETASAIPLPVFTSSNDLTGQIKSLQDEHCVSELQQEQIFLGLVVTEELAHPDVVELIPVLTMAGVRFVYFSPENDQQSKRVAAKLGLEIEWNSHISLSENGEDQYDKAEQHAQLPRGIANIRSHLQHVDDVPLLVPLFSGCSPSATEQMIAIMQENTRVVGCIGSSLNSSNAPAFSRADLSISIDPLLAPWCYTLDPVHHTDTVAAGTGGSFGKTKRPAGLTAQEISASFNALPCALSARRDDKVSITVLMKVGVMPTRWRHDVRTKRELLGVAG